MTIKNAFEELSVQSEQEKQSLLLSAILDRLGFIDPATGGQRVLVANPSLAVAGTVAVSSVANMTTLGTLLTNADQYVQMQIPFANLRSRITIT